MRTARLLMVAAVGAVLFGCSDLQLKAFREFKKESARPVEVEFTAGQPTAIGLKLPAAAGGDPLLGAMLHLNEFKDFYRIDDPLRDLYLKDTDDGELHAVIFGQQIKNIPLFAAGVGFYFSEDALEYVNSTYIPYLEPLPGPELDQRQAVEIIEKDQGTSVKDFEVIKVAPSYFHHALMDETVEFEQEGLRLAYQVNIERSHVHFLYLVDAHNGTILFKEEGAVDENGLLRLAEKYWEDVNLRTVAEVVADDDNDGISNENDLCPSTASLDNRDFDKDGIGDVCDDDDDGDGIPDKKDNCPYNHNPDQADKDGNGIGDACDDLDKDGVRDAVDNCFLPNFGQMDTDYDGDGDVCDEDDDDDGLVDAFDTCLRVADSSNSDSDGDGLGDVCDNCPKLANRDQADADMDGIGDVCDEDDDNDNIPDLEDNCPAVWNVAQIDTDANGRGLACDPKEQKAQWTSLVDQQGTAVMSLPAGFFNCERPFKYEIKPCLDCPIWTDLPLNKGVKVKVPFAAEVKVTNSAGSTLAQKSVNGNSTASLMFDVKPSYNYEAPMELKEAYVTEELSAQLNKSKNRTRDRYYVEIKPTEELGQTEYQVEIEML